MLKRYIGYNLCFILLPVLILVYFYWNGTLKQLVEEYEAMHRYALTQAMYRVDSDLQTLRLTANQLAYDPDLTPYQLQKSEYGRYTAIDRLKSYHSRTNFLDDLLLYVQGDETLYSSDGVLSMSYFIGQAYRFSGGWNDEDFKKLISYPSGFGFSPSGEYLQKNDAVSVRKMVLTYPWANNVGRFGTIIGLVNTNYFDRLFSEINSKIKDAFYILDSNHQIVYSAQNQTHYTSEQLSAIFSGLSEGTSHMEIGGEMQSVIALHSSENGWTYVLAFPQSQFNSELIHIKTSMLALIGLILIISILSGIFLAFRNYLPIRQLNMQLGLDNRSRTHTDELKELDWTFKQIVEQNAGMQLELNESRGILTERFLYKLLTQSFQTCSVGFAEKQKALDIRLLGPCYCVLIFKPPRKLTSAEREAVMDAIRTVPWAAGHYGVEMDYSDGFALLFNTEADINPLLQAVKTLQIQLEEELHFLPVMGVGHIYANCNMISHSFYEAVSAAEASGFSERPLVFFDELKTQRYSSPYWFPPKAQLRLIQGLNQGSRSLVEESIAELSEMLFTQKMESDSVSLRFMISGLIQGIWPIAENMKLTGGNEKIDALVHYSSIQDFIEKLLSLCLQLVTAVEQRRKSEQGLIFNQVLDYVEKHYDDQNLSLKNLANVFDMTDSYLSRFFSSHSGMNFIDYLTNKRMTAASRLLCETDLRIQDIMEKVGYIDLASFTRKFTQVFGLSPGRYRKKHTGKPDDK